MTLRNFVFVGIAIAVATIGLLGVPKSTSPLGRQDEAGPAKHGVAVSKEVEPEKEDRPLPTKAAPSVDHLVGQVSVDGAFAYITFTMDEDCVLRVREFIGQNEAKAADCSVRIGRHEETGCPHEGRVNFVSCEVNPETASVKAFAKTANSDGRFIPGTTVRVQLPFMSTPLLPKEGDAPAP
jgi:hypothetical protein